MKSKDTLGFRIFGNSYLYCSIYSALKMFVKEGKLPSLIDGTSGYTHVADNEAGVLIPYIVLLTSTSVCIVSTNISPIQITTVVSTVRDGRLTRQQSSIKLNFYATAATTATTAKLIFIRNCACSLQSTGARTCACAH